MQCKARIKYLQDEYKRVKDHNSQSGNDRETFEYFEEINQALGCKPNITPKHVLECGLAADDTSAKTGDGEDSPNAGPSIHESDEDQLEMEFEKTLKPGQKHAIASKGKKPAAKKSRACVAGVKRGGRGKGRRVTGEWEERILRPQAAAKLLLANF